MLKNDRKPEIRFAGFDDEWEHRKLETVATFSKGSGYSKGDLQKNGTPIILYGRLYTKYETCISEVDTFVCEKRGSVYSNGGEVIVPASGETAEDIARASTVENKGILLGGDLNVILPNERIDSAFLAMSISNGAAHKELANKAQGKSVVHIHNAEIQALSIAFPSKSEQSQISGYFTRLDHLITLHQQKCDKLKQFKQIMQKKMFPQNDSNTPEIRFSGFTDAWEQCKLGELATKICVGFVGTCEKYYTDNSGIPMYRTGNLNGTYLNKNDMKYVTREFHEKNQKSQLQYGDILIARHGESGKAVIYSENEEANCLNIVIVRPDMMSYNHEFLSEVINSPAVEKRVKQLSAGSTQSVINTKAIEKLDVMIPTRRAEQDKVAEFFSNLDHLITLHQKEVEQLQTFKKACLEKMFV